MKLGTKAAIGLSALLLASCSGLSDLFDDAVDSLFPRDNRLDPGNTYRYCVGSAMPGAAAGLKIRSIGSDGSQLYALCGDAIYEVDVADGSVSELVSGLTNPGSICVGETTIYLSGGSAGASAVESGESAASCILAVARSNGAVSTLAGSAAEAGYAEGSGASVRFVGIADLCLAGGSLYVADGYRVRKLDVATGQTALLAGGGTAGQADGIGAAASFERPERLCSDGEKVYVLDMVDSTYRVRIIDADTGATTTLSRHPIDFAIIRAAVWPDGSGGFAYPALGESIFYYTEPRSPTSEDESPWYSFRVAVEPERQIGSVCAVDGVYYAATCASAGENGYWSDPEYQLYELGPISYH